MSGFFITGTDTDVGKTILSSLLLAALRNKGHQMLPMKPIQTGCTDNIPDLDYILTMNKLTPSENSLSLMAPACYKPACSPHLAAEIEKRPIQIKDILPSFRTLQDQADGVLVEGAGGILVPINQNESMLDLMKAMRLPIILAARPGLGTINHTLLSLQMLKKEELAVAGVVFIHTKEDAGDFTEEDNKKTISKIGQTCILGAISYASELNSTHPPSLSNLPLSIQKEINIIAERLDI